MPDNKPRKTSRQCRRSGYASIVAGLVALGAAFLFNKVSQSNLGGIEPQQSVHVLTKSRPVVGEWILLVSPVRIEFGQMSASMAMLGIVIVLGGLGGLENSKLVERVEKLEETLAAREPTGPR